jgi:hypothetical protein
LRAVAEALNARGVPTARGGEWHPMSVKNLLDRSATRQRTTTSRGSNFAPF